MLFSFAALSQRQAIMYVTGIAVAVVLHHYLGNFTTHKVPLPQLTFYFGR